MVDPTRQPLAKTEEIFERIYAGPGLDGKPWLSVSLGRCGRWLAGGGKRVARGSQYEINICFSGRSRPIETCLIGKRAALAKIDS